MPIKSRMDNIVAHINARAAYELEVIAQAAHPHNKELDHWGSHSLAFMQGSREYRDNVFEVPKLFKGIEILEHAWIDGQLHASDVEEIENCCLCHESNGDPCILHG